MNGGEWVVTATYPPAPFITVSPSLHLKVSATSVPRGATVTVTALNPCPAGNTPAGAAVLTEGSGPTGTATSGADGLWSVDVPIPSTFATGPHIVTGTCWPASGLQSINYVETTITVT
nr:hypothetical protein GCM10020063_085400 [Dactylosporangium thailandense]